MSVWAYPCRPCHGERPDVVWYVAASDCEKLPPDATLVRVQVQDQWRCARLDRSRPRDVEGLLIRSCVAADAETCPECEEAERREPSDDRGD